MDLMAIATGVGGTLLGFFLSLVNQRQQHKLELERFAREQDAARHAALRARGEQLADELLDTLMTLQDVLPLTVPWFDQEPDPAAETLTDEQLRTLARLMVRVPDEAVRTQLQLAHSILRWPDEVAQWGDGGFRSPRQVIWATCQETLDVLGRYVRGESQPAASEVRSRLELAQASTLREKQSQWEEQARSMRED